MTFDNFYSHNFNCEENTAVQKNDFFKEFFEIFQINIIVSHLYQIATANSIYQNDQHHITNTTIKFL